MATIEPRIRSGPGGAAGLGSILGGLVGLGMTSAFAHAHWPVLAGSILGLTCSLAAPARPVLVAHCGACAAVVSAVVTMVAVQVRRGHWPITDDVAIAQYGTTTLAILRAAVFLGVLIGIPCLIAACWVAVARRRALGCGGSRPAASPDHGGTGAGPGR